MQIGTKLCVHCGCVLAQKVGLKWLCARCGKETTPEQQAEAERLASIRRRLNTPHPGTSTN